MKLAELRHIIKVSNKAKLSPIEKDVFLYYYTKTRNQSNEWRCPDTETAAEVERSRNGVAEARIALRDKHHWIEFEDGDKYLVRVTKSFLDFVGNPTNEEPEIVDSVGDATNEDEDSSEMRQSCRNSDTVVGNATNEGQKSVGNPTPYIDNTNSDLKRNLEDKEEEKNAQENARACAECETAEPEVIAFQETADADTGAAEDPAPKIYLAAKNGYATAVGTLAADILPPEETLKFCRAKALDGILREFKLKKLPDRELPDWIEAIDFGHENDFRSEEIVECLQLLRRQPWRTSRVTPQLLIENLPSLEILRACSEREENSDDSGKYYSNNSRRTGTGAHSGQTDGGAKGSGGGYNPFAGKEVV